MNRASMFYSQPSKMSNYPTYERTQVKQRGGGGFYSEKTGDWGRKVVKGMASFLAPPLINDMVAMAGKGQRK